MKASAELQQLAEQVAHLGHPENPFKSKNYAINTAIPCTDFSGWVVGQLAQNRKDLVKELYRRLTYDDGRSDAVVETVSGLTLGKFYRASPISELEWKAILVAGYCRLGRAEWQRKTWLATAMTEALFVHNFEPIPEAVKHILKGANKKDFREMRGGGRAKEEDLRTSSVNESDLGLMAAKALPIATRRHLIHAIERLGRRTKLERCTDYSLREFGINEEASAQLLRDCDFVIEGETLEPHPDSRLRGILDRVSEMHVVCQSLACL